MTSKWRLTFMMTFVNWGQKKLIDVNRCQLTFDVLGTIQTITVYICNWIVFKPDFSYSFQFWTILFDCHFKFVLFVFKRGSIQINIRAGVKIVTKFNRVSRELILFDFWNFGFDNHGCHTKRDRPIYVETFFFVSFWSKCKILTPFGLGEI